MAKQRRIMRKFEIHEISAVDKPAQEGARMVLMKRDTTKDKKKTDATGAHEENLEGMDDSATEDMEKSALEYFKATFTAEQRKDLAGSGAAMPDGSFPIRNKDDLSNALHAQGRAKDVSAARRHIKARAKALGLESTLPDSFGEDANKSANSQGDEEMELKELEKRVVSLEADIAKANTERDEALKVARMSDVEKAAEQDKTNPVVFTSADGTTFRKNDDSRLVAMAKRNDELAKSAREASEREQDAVLSKRCEGEFKTLPGAQPAKLALLKAVSGIADATVRGQVEAILTASASSLAKAFEKVGHRNLEGQGGSPVERLNTLAKKISEDRKVDFAKAYGMAMESAEGKAIYAETIGAGNGI